MKKILSIALLCGIAFAANAVPAKPGWQTYTQADGTTIELMVLGDEYYHYMINREGKQVREVDGMYEVVGEAPTPEVAKARHAKAQARRQRQGVGLTPNLAPKGVVIVANFKDSKLQSSHTQAVFNELCNSLNCTVNGGYPSAGQYFADQSNGTYRPQFDVFGPVTLSRNVSYYGGDTDASDPGSDAHATDAAVEACRLADQQFTVNWSDYDSDNDGYIDFVYLIYAGKGQANGGSTNTIWPHNWNVESARYYGMCTYSESECIVGGVTINNYACSAELDGGNSLCGIGTLCHEFGHVMGLPDLYDINYGTIYYSHVTPNDWNVMDGGSYNGNGHCPPNYDPWQKDFFGWLKPINLGNKGAYVELKANGSEGFQTYQINASGSYVKPTTAGLRYYIENRQQQGWDEPLTGHGMLLWKITYNSDAWQSNSPNESSTYGAPLHTIVSATGTTVGSYADDYYSYHDDCPKNPFPGTGKKSSYTDISGKPLLNIKESNKIITLTYIEEPSPETYKVTWMVNGEVLETQDYALDGSQKLVLPTNTVIPCSGTSFIGWTEIEEWSDPFEVPADLFTTASGKVTRDVIYYALFE